MLKVILVSMASLFGLALVAGGSGTVAEMVTTSAKLVIALVDALAALAQLSAALEHEIVSNTPPAVQAMLGVWICARGVLVIIGLSALRMLSRFARRF